MKQKSLLKTMLLLFALIAGSSSVWAEDETATLAGASMLDGTAAATSYANHFIGVTDDKGNAYTGNWCAQKSGSTYLQMIQLKKVASTNSSYIKLPKFASNIKSITISATNASSEAGGDGAKTALYIIKGTNYNSTEAGTAANQLFVVGNSSTATQTYTFDFTTKDKLYDGEGLYICSKDNSIRIWSIVVVTDGTKNPSAPSPVVESFEITATINSDGTCTCTPSSTAITTSGSVTSSASDLLDGYSYGLKLESKSGAITIDLPDGAINAKITLISKVADYVKVDGVANSVQWSALTSGYSGILGITGDCAIAKGGNDPKIQRITLTYDIPSTTQVAVTTSANMDGWRAFYDASQAYTVDANTTIYTIPSTSGSSVTMNAEAGNVIPAGSPVILKTTAADHKMILTKTTDPATLGSNILAVTNGSSNVDGYRLGYKADPGVAFFKYTTTTAPAAGIVYIPAASMSPVLTFDFGGTTAIKNVSAEKTTAPRKVMKDGRIVIETAEGLFSVSGARVK